MNFDFAPPMFAQAGMPRYVPPFNARTGLSPGIDSAMQVAAPYALQMLLGNDYVQGQFSPEQNLYDQMQSTRFYSDLQKSEGIAARRDQAQLQKMIEGTMRMAGRRELNDSQRQQAFTLSKQASQYMPILSQFLGEDVVDQMFGRTGSAAMMSAAVHRGMRTALDPVTGQIGATGDTSGVMASEMFDRLYGTKADVASMKGITAGAAGELFSELQARGLSGTGFRSFRERLQDVPKLENEEVNRIVDRVIAQRQESGDEAYKAPDEALISKVKKEVEGTISTVREKGETLSSAEIAQMAGGDDVLRVADARRITDRLKNMTGAVAAMKDIFGDAGNPNAPMRQLVAALDAMTQGGLAVMSSQQAETMVRKTHALSQQTGMSVEGIMGLTAQAAGQADALGLTRQQAVLAAQGAAAYGAAAGDTQRLDIAAYGTLSKEEVTLLDAQLRVGAAASGAANTANAALRMQDEGMLNVSGGSKLDAYLTAVRGRQGTFTWTDEKGKTHTESVGMDQTEMLDMLRETGVRDDDAMRIMLDRKGNEEYGVKYDTQTAIRRSQRQSDVIPRVAAAFDAVLGQRLKDKSLGLTDEEQISLSRAGGRATSTAFFDASREDITDKDRRNKLLGDAATAATREQAKRIATARGLSGSDADAFVERVVAGLGSTKSLGGAMSAELGATIANTSMSAFGGMMGLHQMFNARTELAQAERDRQASVTATLQSSMAGLGRSTFVQRISETLASGRSDTSMREIGAQLLGAIPLSELAEKNAAVGGMVAEMERAKNAAGMTEEVKDSSGKVIGRRQTAAGAKIGQDAADRIKAYTNGGRFAQDYLEQDAKKAAGDPTKLSDADRKRMEQAVETSASQYIRDNTKADMSSITMQDLTTTRDRGVMSAQAIESFSSGKAAKESETVQKALLEQVGIFVDQAGQRAEALLYDGDAMEQLGKGGLDLVRGISADHAKLAELAGAAGVTTAELLAGKVPADKKHLVDEARKVESSMRDKFNEVTARKQTGVRPEGDKAMTAAEKEELAAEQKFRRELSPEAQKKSVMDRLMSEATGSTKADLDAQRAVYEAQIGDGRALEINRALEARDALERMASEKGFLVDKDGKKIAYADATEDQRRSAKKAFLEAAGKKDDARLTAEDRAESERLNRQAKKLDFLDGEGNDKNVQRIDAGIRSFQSVSTAAAASKQKVKMEVTGNIHVTGDRGQLTLSGQADPAFNDVQFDSGRAPQFGKSPSVPV